MKVSDVRSARPAGGAKRKKASSGRGAEFARYLSDAAGEADHASGTRDAAPTAGVAPVLAAQEDADAGERRKRRALVAHGEDILDQLEEIRRELLLGRMPKDRLMALARLLRNRRPDVEDPQLLEVIDEIELRAMVEIAKLTRSP
jgi:hypothetical protein